MAKKAESTLLNMVLVLTIISIVAALGLALMNHATEEPIKQAQKEKIEVAIKKVLPEFASLKDTTTIDSLPCHIATNEAGDFVGLAVETFTDKGFNGHIGIMVGFNAEGDVSGYRILETGETPGLGSKAGEWFQKGNKGCIIDSNFKSSEMKVTKDGGTVDAITAATISSRAFCDAINTAYGAFNKLGGTNNE